MLSTEDILFFPFVPELDLSRFPHPMDKFYMVVRGTRMLPMVSMSDGFEFHLLFVLFTQSFSTVTFLLGKRR